MEAVCNGLNRVKVKKKKVTRKDIQENIQVIMEAMKRTPKGTDEYDRLAKELEHEYVVLKKYNESRFIIEPEKWLIITTVGGLVVFFIAVEREVPAAMKFVNLILKLIPFRG